MLESLFNKVEKETSTHVLSCEYCEFFDSKPPVASVDLLFLIKAMRDGFYEKG